MASAAKRPNGKWLGRYRGPDGKERTRTFSTRGDALRWAQEQERKVRRMDWTDPALSRITVGEWCEQWKGTWQVKPKTVASYESLLKTCVLPKWQDVRLDHVTTSSVRTWVAGMTGVTGKPLSASRKRAAYHLLTAMLDAAVEDGRLPKNPARSQTGQGRRSGFLPKLTQGRSKRYLTHEELHRLADAAGDYRTLILFLGYTGLRIGEAAALRVANVDLLRGRVTVSESVADVNGQLIFGPTKTHAVRSVPVPAFLRDGLSLLMVGKGREDLIFTSPEGQPLRLANWRQRVFDKAVREAGLDGLTPHELRHTAASLAVAAGANVKAIQRMLGHKDAAMTLNVYADLFDDDLDGVGERLHEAAIALPRPLQSR
jgi:integrase